MSFDETRLSELRINVQNKWVFLNSESPLFSWCRGIVKECQLYLYDLITLIYNCMRNSFNHIPFDLTGTFGYIWIVGGKLGDALSYNPHRTTTSCDSMHYDDVIMSMMASQITSLTGVYSTVYSDADQRKHQSSASLAFVWGIHRDRWIPRIKGQLRGKCFHLMTSSWWAC